MSMQSLPQCFALKTQEIKHSSSELETAWETGPACSHPEGPSEQSQQRTKRSHEERHSNPSGILLSVELTMPKAEPIFKNKFVLNFLLLEFEKIIMDTDGTYLITTGGKYVGRQDGLNCLICPLSTPIINYEIAEFVPGAVWTHSPDM